MYCYISEDKLSEVIDMLNQEDATADYLQGVEDAIAALGFEFELDALGNIIGLSA